MRKDGRIKVTEKGLIHSSHKNIIISIIKTSKINKGENHAFHH